MGWTESGYGIVVDEACWREDASQTLYKWASQFAPELMERVHEYAADFEDGSWPDEESMFADFLKDYENEETFTSGFEAALVDFINEKEFAGRNVFKFDDCAIYVAAYIPYDDTDKDNRPTQIQIENILAEWANPLLEVPLEVCWQDISFY